MASYQVGETCYPSLGLATQAYIARFVPSAEQLSATTGCLGVPILTTAAPGQITVSYNRIAGSCGIPAPITFTASLPGCALYDTADAATMAWGVAGCWIAVFAVAVILKRALQ